MRKKRFPVLIVVGALLIFISFSLIVSSQICVHVGFVKSQKVVEKIEKLLPKKTGGIADIYSNPSMPILEIDGADYIAVIEVSSLGVKLPVNDKWDKGKLYESPARFSGSCYDNSLVIGGFDSSKQFSFCDKIDNDTIITITDMTGTQFSYSVTRVDRSKNAESQWLVNEEYDLTIFCRDMYGMEYIAVRCVSAKS